MAHPFFFSCLMLATGIGIPVMATLSATLGSTYGSSALAASILFLVALLISVAFLFAVEGIEATTDNNTTLLLLLRWCVCSFLCTQCHLGSPPIRGW